MSSVAGRLAPAMRCAVFTTRRRAFLSDAEKFPYQTVIQLGEIVGITPGYELVHLVPVCCLITVTDESHNCGVSCELYDAIALVFCNAVMSQS
ncbi:hypothetical protein PDJAM_G00103080 [Pangasius djambal]|uniref:Uncharacterized protein n=1 Tax=Pangasius djambal TaxID=1691987 RepID=A0ACC5Y0N6_9TELE|nr:hypothetical protein [Pangasius djambal]